MFFIKVFVILTVTVLHGNVIANDTDSDTDTISDTEDGLANGTDLKNDFNATLLDLASASGNGLFRFGDSYYDFHTDPELWDDARKICDAEGGYLAILNSELEASILAAVFNTHPSSSLAGYILDKDVAFVGFTDYYKVSEYVTIHGQNIEKVGYNKWRQGEPDGPGVQRCGVVDRNGFICNAYCTYPLAFICEIPV
ncbi:hemolymph lipopolysaccharide-binding protein-like [Chrysoperla carnea]|uniref:hemolymph lipopolysaccharide-binding protein-like n=1 Tax=Chrysoperla carnea TaxID=189513 RepID=UPI001D066A57|nr:hemolymph lipopolysaccharide-binding protein-like [Chrysoperla carnea]